MPPLSSNLRNQLERTVIAARDVAEEGAWAALERLAVGKAKLPSHITEQERVLRRKLRARGKQLGDRRHKNAEQDIHHLTRECAYEHWHQMLFARFLAENQLLMHPDGVAVSLEECEELAAEEGTDGWTLAARYASRMLPQIFRPDDPLLAVTFAPEDKQALEKLLADLPQEVFMADDSLGWVYQFWQTKRKKEVNDSGEKIGADELPAVTQLFTEDYMVKFLLHNTLGAWWAGKKLTTEDARSAQSEDELRAKVALPGVDWEYLRFVREESDSSNPKSEIRNQKSIWRPAAGTFDGWPKQAAELKIMDPCCGSGHFLVAAFDLMVRIRMEEEGLSPVEACDAVLRDNLHGLEIDQRCTQIAAFALAFAAWTFPDAGGYRELPELHVACAGIAPQATEDQWVKLAEQSGIPVPRGGAGPIQDGLRNLHRLFSQAPVLGSLIEPAELPSDLIAADYDTLQPYLASVLASESGDGELHERVIAAAGMTKAAGLLALLDGYTLVITNVPYLARGKQHDFMQSWAERHAPDAKADLATMFVSRAMDLLAHGGSLAAVVPQGWLYLTNYRGLRQRFLRDYAWNLVTRLGPGAFETISGHVVNVALAEMTRCKPAKDHSMVGLDASKPAAPKDKASLISGKCTAKLHGISQAQQLGNADSRVLFTDLPNAQSLREYADFANGLQTCDYPRFIHCFWEANSVSRRHRYFQSTVKATQLYGGLEQVILWGSEGEAIVDDQPGAVMRGAAAWGKPGVAISAMSEVKASLYCGCPYDDNTVVIVPKDLSTLAAIWACCSSSGYNDAVRKIDRALKVRRALLEVPFVFDDWQDAASNEYPSGLPEPESDDPTQWLFHGRPEHAVAPPKVDVSAPLHVGVARLLGYRWPAELDDEMRLSERARALVKQCDELLPFADEDGIVCIPAVAGESTGADRLQSLLSACGVKPTEDLDAWLRDKFFEEHCQLFHQRPFIWHIWDGRRKDGFHALVNYHKLDRKLLEKLIYGHLGDWISRQQGAERRGESGAEARRLAAEDLQQRLRTILEGEPPYDIFVRWKPLEEQPIGWDPDLNDGVRVNIRPFMNAGVLRKNPKIKWKKDRGKEPERPKDQYPWFWGWDEETKDFPGGPTFDGNRWNDCHYSNKAKRAARSARKDEQ